MGFREARSLPSWRRIALSAWGPPRSPAAYGAIEIDCEPALAYIRELRAETAEKITVTHLVGRAVALALAEHPEVNGFVSFGRLMLRDSVDVFFQVAFTGEGAEGGEEKGNAANLAGAKVCGADKKSVVAIARELRDRTERIRARGDVETARGSSTLAKLPAPLVGLATRAGAALSYDLGLDLRRFGIPYDAFGSCMVTNVGVFGIATGWAPLLELSRVPIVLTLGAVREAPAVKDGALVVRRSLTVGVAFDHRVMDGYHAGKMARRFVAAMENPSVALAPT